MQNKKYDTIVYIGRFQPMHNAHLEIIRRAKSLAHQVVVVIGSADQPRTYKNPFLTHERVEMVRRATSRIGDPACSLQINTVRDNIYNNQAWAAQVQNAVYECHMGSASKIGIIGHEKDETSFYLKLFPQWTLEDVELIEPLHATDIRDLYFREDAHMGFLKHVVPEVTHKFLIEFCKTEAYQDIIKERQFVETYKRQFASLPYPPVFVTTDAVVIQSGHVLMIKRRAYPGKGLWALPGGFLDTENDKSVQDCAIRELKEETGIKVPVPVLVGSIKDSKVFDAINRSTRGRTITHAFKIVLPDGELPKVKGQDDAEKAQWVPIGELNPSECYEDHMDIISYFVGF